MDPTTSRVIGELFPQHNEPSALGWLCTYLSKIVLANLMCKRAVICICQCFYIATYRLIEFENTTFLEYCECGVVMMELLGMLFLAEGVCIVMLKKWGCVLTEEQ